MAIETISVLAKVAAPAGLAIGTFLYVMRDIIAKNIFPSLTKERAYHVILIITFASWSIALAAIGAWIYVITHENKAESPATISESDRNRIASALSALTYIEAGQRPIPLQLRVHCIDGATKPDIELMRDAKQNLDEITEARKVLQSVPQNFIINEIDSFRQLQLDLAKRAQILPSLANGSSFLTNGKNVACELSLQYQELHERLWPLARKLKEFVENQSKNS